MRAELVDDGGAGPPIVFLPGIGGTSAMALHCVQRLRPAFRVLRLRWVGGGDDDYPGLAASVLQVLEANSVGRAVLLAESFGVAVALQTALLAPAQVAGLALVNGFARYPRRGRLRLTRLASGLVGDRFYAWFRRRVGIRKLLGPRWTPELAAALAAKRTSFDAAYRARLRMLQRLDLVPRLGEVICPVALFAADQDRIVPAVPCARQLLAGLPDATLQVVPRAGHLLLPLAELPWPEWLAALWARAGGDRGST
ncbi:MAG: alpha/beta fold hydrolase [Planctomycetes bacterium]|nr:alpha/beta fold hydrolase [Planctomycetota bacterium]MCB9886087.1 alpha/beta fold hydrolase [Planctomycetota bacterium]